MGATYNVAFKQHANVVNYSPAKVTLPGLLVLAAFPIEQLQVI